jgi:alpha-ketoglutarate-dependent taurine dioxygenase
MNRPLFLVCVALILSGCSSVYYGAMEKLGIPKRQILVERVQAAQGAQEQAKEQFASALEQFLAVTKVPATELKAAYDRLNDEFQRSEERAKEVRDRIAAIDDVAGALFSEWNRELAQYTNASLRAQSERQLNQTRRRYEDLLRTMRTAAERMDPVLATFRDQVLFLKHNLNAQAVGALGETSRELQQDIQRLIADMEKSIRESQAFIASIETAQ